MTIGRVSLIKILPYLFCPRGGAATVLCSLCSQSTAVHTVNNILKDQINTRHTKTIEQSNGYIIPWPQVMTHLSVCDIYTCLFFFMLYFFLCTPVILVNILKMTIKKTWIFVWTIILSSVRVIYVCSGTFIDLKIVF